MLLSTEDSSSHSMQMLLCTEEISVYTKVHIPIYWRQLSLVDITSAYKDTAVICSIHPPRYYWEIKFDLVRIRIKK